MLVQVWAEDASGMLPGVQAMYTDLGIPPPRASVMEHVVPGGYGLGLRVRVGRANDVSGSQRKAASFPFCQMSLAESQCSTMLMHGTKKCELRCVIVVLTLQWCTCVVSFQHVWDFIVGALASFQSDTFEPAKQIQVKPHAPDSKNFTSVKGMHS